MSANCIHCQKEFHEQLIYSAIPPGVARTLDCAERVGILVSVEMNVAVDHFILKAGMRRVRIFARVTR